MSEVRGFLLIAAATMSLATLEINHVQPMCAGHCVVLHSRFEGADVAADIIGAGPEPLTSQFAAGYGMVLNLLHTRCDPAPSSR